MSKFTRLFKLANAARLATYLIALWKLFKHPQTPLAAKLVAIAVIAYAVSPIDLIPDFIPLLGQLDELILLPLGVALAMKEPLGVAGVVCPDCSLRKSTRVTPTATACTCSRPAVRRWCGWWTCWPTPWSTRSPTSC